MKRPGGALFETSLETGKVKEYDTYTCKHCGSVAIVWRHSANAGFFCSHCSGIICKKCASQGDCDPMTEKLERWAAQDPHFQNMKEI